MGQGSPPRRGPGLRRRVARIRALAWLALALATAACASTGRSVLEIPVERAAPAALGSISTDAEVMSVVSWHLVHRLGLPLSSPLYAHFYPTQGAFELGLVADGGVEPGVAKDQARFATGVGFARGIFVRADKVAGAPLPLRVHLFAHELTHVSQYGLASGRRGSSEQWLREGFADWAGFRVLDLLGLRPYAESKRRVLQEVRRAGPADRFPALGVLVTNRQWIRARNEAGGPRTYGQAFLATDWLIERYGSARAIQYFRRFGRSDDRVGNFRAAFGIPPGQFAEEFRARLQGML